MNALHLVDHDADNHAKDLDSAFNDDFQSSENSVGAALVRWLVILWVITTLAVGTFVMARALLAHGPQILAGLAQIFS